MEFTNPFQRAVPDNGVIYCGPAVNRQALSESQMHHGRQASRASSCQNFSYPRPDGHPPRHESVDSRSSFTSNGSVPGMTDASDSEVSVDDDYHYNASATQLWDSYYTNKAQYAPSSRSSATLHSFHAKDYFNINFPTPRLDTGDDDTITLTRAEQGLAVSPSTSPTRPKTARHPASYSVYPRIADAPPRPAPIPPRTTSLANDLPVAASRDLKPSKSIGHLRPRRRDFSSAEPLPSLRAQPLTSQKPRPVLKAAKSSLTLQPQPLISPALLACHNADKARTAPVSPMYPLLEFGDNINDNRNCHNATAPLTPLTQGFPSSTGPGPVRPQIERFVSVFEFDSDNDSEVENANFAKRFARGLHAHKKSKDLGSGSNGDNSHHKKSKSEIHHKRGLSEKHGGDNGGEVKPDAEKPTTVGRKRGGSLGRYLGLKSR